MGPENGFNPNEKAELVERHFDTIAKILKNMAHVALTDAYRNHSETYGIEKLDGSNAFQYRGKSFHDLEQEISEVVIIKPNESKTDPSQLYIAEFIVNFGLPMEAVDEVLTRYLGYTL